MKALIGILVVLVVIGRFVTGINGEGGWYLGGVGDGMEIHWERWYIDLAHAVVFGMLGAAWMGWFYRYNAFDAGRVAKRLFVIAACITALEVGVAVGARKLPAFGHTMDRWNIIGEEVQ